MKLGTIAAVGLLALALGGCGGSEDSSSAGSTAAASGGSGSAKLELDDNYFEPKTVSGTPGQKLTIELDNEGDAEHNFTIDDQSVDQDVEAGESASVTVTVPQSGTVAFYCKYHKSSGMTGRLGAGSAAGGGGGTSTGDDMMNGGTSTEDDSGGIGY